VTRTHSVLQCIRVLCFCDDFSVINFSGAGAPAQLISNSQGSILVRNFYAALFLTLTLNLAIPGFSEAAEDTIQFDRDVRPILSDKCFFCHGPDAAKREANLRLDVRDAAVTSGAVTPGNPDESEMLRRILSDDPDEQMPPPSAKLGRLTKEEVSILRQWIEQGAEYQGHWAFIPLSAEPEAGASTSAEASRRIDGIVQRGLQSRGLRLQPEADRNTLIRRLSFDLTGLPPTIPEIEAFVADADPNAVEKLVDRLLSSPHYGERMAVDWLDASRYADSYGFQVDREREMWPWRDWVVKSFNDNRPFDQFITWQLAGDLLPEATDEQILATAFNRLHQQESEGGSVEEEYRVEYVCDRVQTFATTFLGLTFECARCHDHKYDPISQKEFYQLFSIFQNIDEAGLYSYFTMSPPTPALTLTSESSKQRLQALQQDLMNLEHQSAALRESRQMVFRKWLSQSDRQSLVPELPELGSFEFESLDGDKLANRVSADKPALLRGENRLVPGRSGNAIEFTGDDPVDLPFGNFRREDPFSISLWLMTPDVKERSVVFHRSRAWTDAASRGYELLIEEGKLKWSLIHFWPGNAISIASQDLLPVGEWVHVLVSSDGGSRASGLTIFINGQPAAVSIVKDNLSREITGGGGDNIALGERFRDRGFKGGKIDDFRVFNRRLSSLESLATFDESAATRILRLPIESQDAAQQNLLFDYYLAAIDAEWSGHLAALKAARTELAKFNDSLTEIMVMRELSEPKQAWVLFRGEYAERREEVKAGFPAALSPPPDGAPMNRLGLAQWITDPRHPLTARVTVNRVWQSLFGHGLVRTAEDFGSQGARPLYPEVLDTLALHLIRSGWDMKQLVRSIVLTETYRQQSSTDQQTLTDDPDNEWLARGPRFRLSAEMIRDNALFAAGLLNPAMGGPPVNPYEMTESFKPAAAGEGDAVYRRSLYTNWRRTGPPPAMIAFDAPRRAVCAAKRERTDSPLQALILLNGVQYVEAARVLGEALHSEADGEVLKMIEQGCLRCLSRRPDPRETKILSQLYQEQLEYFKTHPGDAEQLLKIGRKPYDTSIGTDKLAAAAMLAQALLNHDECVVKR